ncbi:hypothetical protein [Halopseudomonas xiamenensis]|uniref:hypothetical protein n=1 Tax=Halopseudomonas xiamenensis TaxID=157792 RepID=UPI001623540C|nr:hypothetical protein [Halopseudomonas xiamenensis]
MSKALSQLLEKLRPALQERIAALPSPWPRHTLFLSLCDGQRRAFVVHASGADFDELWDQLSAACQQLAARRKLSVRWLRADWVTAVQPLTWQTLRGSLKLFKRNYFRYGLALDAQFQRAFVEGELNGNAMLYGGIQVSHAVLNESNFRLYTGQRFPGPVPDFADDAPVYLLSTEGLFCDLDSAPVALHGIGRDAGRRVLDCDADTVRGLIERGSHYLASQVRQDGRFHYGWHPCFDRPINAYNTLRHASTLYSMLEAWEVTREPELAQAIERGLDYLCSELIKRMTLPGGERAAFLLDVGNEIKLGGNAVCLLALVKYSELFDSDRHLALLEELALGIRHMQDPDSGQFVHVLNYPALDVKAAFRIIYYDGEAAFGLMRLYRLTSDERWLSMVEKAFDSFIEREHWKAHDHWLGYCVNELTRYRPEERYFRFGIRNVADHLDFVLKRITTFPTLLELMMAARRMLDRIAQSPEHRHLLGEIDLDKFDRALHFRAAHLMNGHFWPEYAMYFRNPARILGSFFIRHQAFRVRIDDVEHYLSGYAAYFHHLQSGADAMTNMTNAIDPSRQAGEPEVLCARLANFRVDVARLREHFESVVTTVEPIPYRDNRVDYLGWAVTSRDGSVDDGVRRIPTQKGKVADDKGNRRGVTPSQICTGYLAEVMDQLGALPIAPYRARFMQLESEGEEMPFHTDAKQEAWRLHIPLVTNPDALFQWRLPDGRIESVHLPADGSAWLVRVDVMHRAINPTGGTQARVHLLMGLGKRPSRELLVDALRVW